jgi:hypothetical protein
MIVTLSQTDWLLLVRLIIAHLITEGFFQLSFWKSWNSNKKFILRLCSWLIQGVFAGVISYFWAGPWNPIWLLFVIFIDRVLINWWEYKNKKISTNLFFILKHSVYLMVILGCWIGLVGISLEEIIKILTSVVSNGPLWFVSLAYIVLIWPVGSLIGRILESWRKELPVSGLAKSGLWLGRLERVLILTFVLLNKYEAIAFLITVKILRFNAIKDSNDKKESEYILIGTLISFVIAIIVGIFTDWSLKQLKP